MDLEFISANKDKCHASEFLRHMGDLQNIYFSVGQSFMDVINLLKQRNTTKEKTEAIDEWLELNNVAKTMSANEAFGLEEGYATFNFRENR